MDAETLNYQKRIIHNYWQDVSLIPVFINNSNPIHIKMKEIVREMFGKICILLEPKVLTTRVITRLQNVYNDYIIDMMEIDLDLTLLYYEYIREMLDCYKGDCLDGELYESAQNIENFLTYYKKNTLDI
jgi:hypothetical protein